MAYVTGGTTRSYPLICNKIEKTMLKKELAYSRVSEDKLRAINLNLLPILRELLRFQKVSQAAVALNMSQSAVSDALSRLRQIFQDELLIPSGRAFTLSEKAKEIEPAILGALGQLETILNAGLFGPLLASGKVQISAADAIVVTLGTRLVKKVRTIAPNVSIQFHGSHEGNIQELASGLIDFSLVYGYRPPRVIAPLKATQLYNDRLVVLAGDRFEQTGGRLERPYIDKLGQSAVDESANDDQIIPDEVFVQHDAGTELRKILMPSLRLLPVIAQSKNTLSLIPQRFAQRLQSSGRFTTIDCDLPNIFAFVLWNEARTNDALHRWVLSVIKELGVAINAESTLAQVNSVGEEECRHS
jgi:DNA-binding transcriptional LysR family regulator